MSTTTDTGRRLFGLLAHAGAIVVGIVLMLIGLGMGVTVFLIPIGVPIGLAGLAIFLWGIFERRRVESE